jgi:NIMA (never in mitosis gene a)-related kinase
MTSEERRKAQDEVSVLASLHHRNIASYKESFQERDSLFIIMEFVDGGDLEKKIAQRGTSHFSEKKFLCAFVQVLFHSHLSTSVTFYIEI